MNDNNNGFDPKRLDRIADWMQRDIDAGRFAGSSVLITRSGCEVYFHSAGLRNVKENLPFQRDSVARIYSMTKPITSVALMMLVERGLIHLDAPLSDFLPAYNDMQALVPNATSIDQTEPSQSPTLHQLLTHTAGMSYPFNSGVLPRAMETENIFFKPDQGELSTMTDRLAALPLAFQPGRQWEYSVSIDVLGRVIEVVSGKTFAEFLNTEIITPLGMTTTGFSVPEGVGDRFASLYTPPVGGGDAQDSDVRTKSSLHLMEDANESPFRSSSMQSGGGGLVSTIDDYMIFATMLRQGGAFKGARFLSSSTVSFMMQNHLPHDIATMGPTSFAGQSMEGLGFGLGGAVVLNPARARCPGSVGDYSWGGMASTFFWIDSVHDLNVIFFTQLVPSNAYPARSKLKALVHGALAG